MVAAEERQESCAEKSKLSFKGMATDPTLAKDLRDSYAAESARLRQQFLSNRNGRAAVHGRTALVDSVAHRLWKEIVSPDLPGPPGFALVALGGYGRRWLFPYSDIDILFLHDANNSGP